MPSTKNCGGQFARPLRAKRSTDASARPGMRIAPGIIRIMSLSSIGFRFSICARVMKCPMPCLRRDLECVELREGARRVVLHDDALELLRDDRERDVDLGGVVARHEDREHDRRERETAKRHVGAAGRQRREQELADRVGARRSRRSERDDLDVGDRRAEVVLHRRRRSRPAASARRGRRERSAAARPTQHRMRTERRTTATSAGDMCPPRPDKPTTTHCGADDSHVTSDASAVRRRTPEPPAERGTRPSQRARSRTRTSSTGRAPRRAPSPGAPRARRR